jgi:hypothetical protein
MWPSDRVVAQLLMRSASAPAMIGVSKQVGISTAASHGQCCSHRGGRPVRAGAPHERKCPNASNSAMRARAIIIFRRRPLRWPPVLFRQPE